MDWSLLVKKVGTLKKSGCRETPCEEHPFFVTGNCDISQHAAVWRETSNTKSPWIMPGNFSFLSDNLLFIHFGIHLFYTAHIHGWGITRYNSYCHLAHKTFLTYRIFISTLFYTTRTVWLQVKGFNLFDSLGSQHLPTTRISIFRNFTTWSTFFR